MVLPPFTCRDCGAEFTLSAATLARYTNWTPRQCMSCRKPTRAPKRPALAADATLDAYTSGPQSGVFTDGSCDPNPGRGGWGAVKVAGGEILAERFGGAPDTTNNRMELTALIQGYQMTAPDEVITVYSDSNLCVQTINVWAAGWEKRGWRRKAGDEIKNLDLVQELYALAKTRPNATLEWIKAHVGSRWNEYADALARRHGAVP